MSQSINPEQKEFVRTAMKYPMLEATRELQLARLWCHEGDENALHELTGAYLRLVIALAPRFRHYGLPVSDLIQEGTVGLMQAAARFDPDRKVRFSTYAKWWVRAAMQDFVLRNWSIVRTGTTAAQKSLFFNLRRLRAKIQDMDDGVLKEESKVWIARELGLKTSDVETMAGRLLADRSLNAPIVTTGDAAASEWQDMLPDTAPPVAEQIMMEHDNQRRGEWIAQALEVLNQRELEIIRSRALAEKSKSLEVLGQQLGLSKERVRQIEGAALIKLREKLVRLVGDPELAGLIPDR